MEVGKDCVELSNMGVSSNLRGVCVSRNMALYTDMCWMKPSSFLYGLWDASPDNVILGLCGTFFHRLASSLASLAFIVLLMYSFKLFHVSGPRYTQFSLLLAGFCLLILMTTPLQQFAPQINGYFPDSPVRDPSSSSDLGRELNLDTGWQPELPGAFYPGSTLEVTPETQQFMNEIPQEELAKALQEIDERIAPDHISELQQKGKVGYTNKHLGTDWQTSLHDEASISHPGDPGFKLPSALTVIFEIARWGSVVVKAILAAISLNLKRCRPRLAVSPFESSSNRSPPGRSPPGIG